MLTAAPRPSRYLHARNLHAECGAYQLQAVLNAFGKDAPVEELYWSAWMRRKDWSLPWLLPSILRRYGIRASWRFSWRSTLKKKLLAALTRGRPILVVINSMRTTGCLHWIGVWGYDESTDEFLVYDSQSPEAGADAIGNTRYPTAELLASLPSSHGTLVVSIKK